MQLIAFVMGALIALGGTQLDWNYAINPEDGPSQQTFGAFSDPFISIQLAENPSNGNCLTTDGTNNIWSSSCGSGGGGSGGGTWSTTTSQVSGRLINYPNNATDIVAIGSNSTTTAEFWFDPNTNRSLIPFASSTAMTIATAYLTNLFIGADTIAEYIADTAGAMFTGNTESGITVTYQDSDNTTDFTVAAGVANLTSSDFGDWTCNGSACTIDADAIALGTDTTGNYLATLSSSGSITVGNSGSETAAVTVNLNLGNANTWTALQTFANSSTTLASFSYASSTKWFGGGLISDCDSTSFLQWTAGKFGCGTPSGGASTDKFATSSNPTTAIYPNSATALGIGTTTPRWPLQLFSSSGPQLTLSGGSSHWSWRAINGNLYLATSSLTTFATSSTPIMRISSTGTTTFSGVGSATSTTFIYSTASGKGGSIILEDVTGTSCTEIYTTAGTVSGRVVTCPTQE